ncbi:hypothetical protein Tco_1489594 [Tanacetum coccineum]
MLWGIVTKTNVDYAELLWEEFVQGIQTFFTHWDSNKIPSKKPTPHIIPYCWFTKLIIYYLGSKYNIHMRPESPRHVTGDDFLLVNLNFILKGEKDEVFGMPIPNELITEAFFLAPSDRHAVRSHMRILSVVSLKTISRYGYTYLKEIVLRRADYKEYKISESDFKNLHPNDFKDLYLLHLQGKLNHLSGSDKVHLLNATKLNLTEPNWDASNFLFKEDYTIVSKPRSVIYKDRNDQKKMMRETKVHKFSDGTLNRILDKLDHMVKVFKLFKYNLGMESRIWYEDDRRRSKDFME